MHKNFSQLGVPNHDEHDVQFAKQIRVTLSEADKRNDIRFAKELQDFDLSNRINPYREVTGSASGSTDVGDVSWIVPTAQCRVATWALGTPAHSWQAVAQGTTPLAHKGMLHAGKVIAATAVDILQNPRIIDEAKAELKERLEGSAYVCPIPKHVKPSPIK
jgi:aminobenzoyl-glutamate utilization protein B